ncbi:MAG TPA: hypothetical protein PKD32_11055 [Saprospiraceae bacterium]|nr:hypothetical protein [Saprospiraceae bacterium]
MTERIPVSPRKANRRKLSIDRQYGLFDLPEFLIGDLVLTDLNQNYGFCNELHRPLVEAIPTN